MTARISTHIDLDEVEASPWACGPYARQALVTATRALLAVVEHEGLRGFEADALNEPWASALAAAAPFRAEVLLVEDVDELSDPDATEPAGIRL